MQLQIGPKFLHVHMVYFLHCNDKRYTKQSFNFSTTSKFEISASLISGRFISLFKICNSIYNDIVNNISSNEREKASKGLDAFFIPATTSIIFFYYYNRSILPKFIVISSYK